VSELALNPHSLLNWYFPPVEQTICERDVILYALGVGIGRNPTDPDHLQYVVEGNLKVLPSMTTVIASPGFWYGDPKTEIDVTKMLHVEQWFECYQKLPSKGIVVGQEKVLALLDKGAAKGALLTTERTLTEKSSGRQLARICRT
jgi:hypothetical protein